MVAALDSQDDVLNLKNEFPILVSQDVVYLDSAASAQKPSCVLDELTRFYSSSYANVHRGVYELGEKATACYEESRKTAASFINAASPTELIFTRGSTESLNLVAYCYAGELLKPGDEIVVSIAEHHSNFVPWQQVAKSRGLEFKVVYLDENEGFSLELFKEAITEKTKLVAITQLANALGNVPPLAEIISLAHGVGAVAVVDAAQGAPHIPIDVQELDCDFLAFSGHKIYGPSGIGVLYGKEALLDAMPPFQFGGEMIESVKVDSTEFNILPYKFEAGTPNIAGAVGLGEAIRFFSALDHGQVQQHEQALVSRLETGLADLDGVRVFGQLGKHTALVTFTVEGVHALDLAEYMGQLGIAIRAGHHCAEPLMHALGVGSTARASLGVYNTADDIERFFKGLRRALQFFRR